MTQSELFPKKGVNNHNSIHCLCYVYIIIYIIIGIILIQHDNDNEKLDFVLTKSAVDSLVES